jgi:DNA-binding CsgD family transcriptional regulator
MSNLLQFKPSYARLTLTQAEVKTWAILGSKFTSAEILAQTYDVSSQTVRNIKLLKTRRARRILDLMHEDGEVTYTWAAAPRFSPKQVADIRASKLTSGKLAREYGVSASTIRMVKTGKTYVS